MRTRVELALGERYTRQKIIRVLYITLTVTSSRSGGDRSKTDGMEVLTASTGLAEALNSWSGLLKVRACERARLDKYYF